MPAENQAPKPKPPRSWLRRASKWCFRGGVLIALTLVYAFVHLNQIGLPEFIKSPLLAELRARGIELDFHRIRFRLTRGIVAEKVRVLKQAPDSGGEFSAEELHVKLSHAALLHGRVEVVAIRLRDGRLVVPIIASNQPPAFARVEQVDTRIRFLATNLWELSNLDGRLLGGEFHASGLLTNPAALFRPREPRPPASDAWKRPFGNWLARIEAMQFKQPPRLDLTFEADATQPELSRARLRLATGGAVTEFGDLFELRLGLDVAPAAAGRLHGELDLTASEAKTRWGLLKHLTLKAGFDQPPTNQPPSEIHWELGADGFTNQWVGVDRLRANGRSQLDSRVEASVSGSPAYQTRFDLLVNDVRAARGHAAEVLLRGEARHAATNWTAATIELRVNRPDTDWGHGETVVVHLEGGPAPAPGSGLEQRPELGPWNHLLPLVLKAEVRATNVVSPRLAVPAASLRLDWKAPRLELVALDGALYGGALRATGLVDVVTREAVVDARENIDLHAVGELLTENARQWLSQFTWKDSPPVASAMIGVTLPAWTNRHPNWRAEVMPTLRMAGSFSGTNFGFRGVPGTRAEGSYALTNGDWTLPQVRVERPEGNLAFRYLGNMFSHDYYFALESTIDPKIVMPLLEEPQRQAFKFFAVSTPPRVEGEVWGRWFDRERTGFRAHVVATNSIIRGEPCDFVDGHVSYTNRMLTFANVHFRQGAGASTVPGAAYWINERQLSFTNAVTTLRPDSVTRVIGPKISALLSPYHYVVPPRIVIDGVIGTANEVPSDATFDIEGGEFHWMRLRADTAKAVVRLVGERVAVTNLVATIYGGRLDGNLVFNQQPAEGSKFNFGLNITNIDLRRLMADVSDRTNRLEGQLSGVLNLDEAHSWDTNSWRGHGRLVLREGFLWDTPVFGVFSPIFEGISPGLGQTRFSHGEAHFVVTNSVARTENLEVRSPAIRLKYSGTVALDTHLDARMEAELLKDMPVLGPLISAALTPFTKLFEYRVRGTLTNPEAEPLYIPKLLLVPLHPLKSIKELFGPTEKKPPEKTVPAPEPQPPK